MSSKNEDQIRALKEKARADLSDAELLLENGTAESTINRAYYAVFQAGRASEESRRHPHSHRVYARQEAAAGLSRKDAANLGENAGRGVSKPVSGGGF